MSNAEKIKYIQHRDIDCQRWDRCISGAANSRLYAISWYLDRAADRWDALVWGDYRYVMPLPYKQKLGIKYLYQPWFCQQLGIFPAPPDKITREFYLQTTRHFCYADLQINASNRPDTACESIRFLPRRNFLLPLFTAYESLAAHYATNTRRNINKAINNRLFVIEGIPMEKYIDFLNKHQPIAMSTKNFKLFRRLTAYLQYQGFGTAMGIYTAGNELCAAALICRWQRRILYLNPVSNDAGRKSGAMFYLIDHLIQNNAATNVTIDFEGSMVPGIARFFRGFGATPETYHLMGFNRLPRIIRWIKKEYL